MVRLAVISWLVVSTLLGPALCCCTYRTLPVAATPSETPAVPACPCCCCEPQPAEAPPADEAPRPQPCPCKHAGPASAVLAEGRGLDLEPFLQAVIDTVATPTLDSTDLALAASPRRSPPSGFLSPAARLAWLQLLRC